MHGNANTTVHKQHHYAGTGGHRTINGRNRGDQMTAEGKVRRIPACTRVGCLPHVRKWCVTWKGVRHLSLLLTARKIVNKQKIRGEMWGGGEVKGGWPLLAVIKREWITGSCVLYEADREESESKEMTLKAHSQNEREARLPLERALRLTLFYYSPISICKYSMSSHNSSFYFTWSYFVHCY